MAKNEIKVTAAGPEVDVNAIAQALAAPFDPAEVKFKPQTVSGNRALAVPFVDARVIQDRLDDVLGVMGWQDSYECLPEGSVVCRLQIRLGQRVDHQGGRGRPERAARRGRSAQVGVQRRAEAGGGEVRHRAVSVPREAAVGGLRSAEAAASAHAGPAAPGPPAPRRKERQRGEEGGQAEGGGAGRRRRRSRRAGCRPTGRNCSGGCPTRTRAWRSRGCARRATWSSTSCRRARRRATIRTCLPGAGRPSSSPSTRRRRSRAQLDEAVLRQKGSRVRSCGLLAAGLSPRRGEGDTMKRGGADHDCQARLYPATVSCHWLVCCHSSPPRRRPHRSGLRHDRGPGDGRRVRHSRRPHLLFLRALLPASLPGRPRPLRCRRAVRRPRAGDAGRRRLTPARCIRRW